LLPHSPLHPPLPREQAAGGGGGLGVGGSMALADATAFPYGLRVLVVDDDPTWIKILEKMLRKCSYEGWNLCFTSSLVLHPDG